MGPGLRLWRIREWVMDRVVSYPPVSPRRLAARPPSMSADNSETSLKLASVVQNNTFAGAL